MLRVCNMWLFKHYLFFFFFLCIYCIYSFLVCCQLTWWIKLTIIKRYTNDVYCTLKTASTGQLASTALRYSAECSLTVSSWMLVIRSRFDVLLLVGSIEYRRAYSELGVTLSLLRRQCSISAFSLMLASKCGHTDSLLFADSRPYLSYVASGDLFHHRTTYSTVFRV